MVDCKKFEYSFSTAFNDPLWNLTDLGDNKLFSEIITAYAPTVNLSTVIEKPGDFADNDLASHIELKAPSGGGGGANSSNTGYDLGNEFIKMESQYAPDQERKYELYIFNGPILQYRS